MSLSILVSFYWRASLKQSWGQFSVKAELTVGVWQVIFTMADGVQTIVTVMWCYYRQCPVQVIFTMADGVQTIELWRDGEQVTSWAIYTDQLEPVTSWGIYRWRIGLDLDHHCFNSVNQTLSIWLGAQGLGSNFSYHSFWFILRTVHRGWFCFF